MEHIRIAYYLLALLVGTAAIVHVLLRGRGFRLPFPKPFAWFLGFNNFLALVNLTSVYACANLLGLSALFRYSVFARILGPAARLSQVGIVYSLFTVKNQITHIYQQMGARNRWQPIRQFHSGRQERPSAGPLPSGRDRTPEKGLWHE